MSRIITNATLALAALTLTFATSTDSAACGGGGGGYRGGGRISVGYGGGGYRHAPRYNPAPVYRQPVYQQPAPQQVIVQQPTFQQPVQPFPQASQVAPGQQQAFQQQQGFQQQPAQQPIQQQPVQQQQPAPQQVAPQAAPAGTPEQSALNALAAFGGVAQPAAAPAQPQQAGHIGSWRATVGGSQVALNLSADGSFNWTANSNGKTSSFAGRFTIANGQLNLIRSDNQQLAGSWIADATGGFRFKLASAKDNGLLFVRG